MDFQVVIGDVRNLTTRSRQIRVSVTWIVLYIYGLEGVIELVVQELDITCAAICSVRYYGANCHSNSKPNVAVTHDDVLRALCILTVPVHIFDSNSVVIVSDIQSLNQNVLSTRVDSVSIEGICRQVLPADAIRAVVIITVAKQKSVKL